MPTSWDRIKAVQRMQDYIEGRLTAPVSLAELARAARYSPWHAARVFKEVTGRAPFEYLRMRRLSVAAQRLESSGARVIDVALDFVFDSHAGFTRAFSRQFGVPPTRFRRGARGGGFFLPQPARELYTRRQTGDVLMESKLDTVFVQALDWPARAAVVRRGVGATHYFEYCEEVGCAVWDVLSAIEGALEEPMGLWLPAGMRPEGTSAYVQAVAVPADYEGALPEGFELMELPACKMLVFQGPPFEDEEFEGAISSLWEVMKTYRPETYGFVWADEDGPRFQLQPLGYRGYIEGRPVRSVGTR